MDMSEYKKEFVNEARDHLDTLNDGLLVLEKDSSDEENINQLFRAFHTLKGNSAAMGFMKFSELAHSLEDVLSSVRDKKLSVHQDVMDLLFDGCDLLEQGLGEIETGDPDNISVESVIAESKQILGVKEEVFKVEIKSGMDLSAREKSSMQNFRKKKINVFRIILVFEKKNFLKAAKSSLILRNLSNDSDLIKSSPPTDDIKQGKFESEVEFVIATKKSKKDVEEIVNGVSGTSHYFILTPEEKYIPPDDLKNQDSDETAGKTQTDTQSNSSNSVKQIQSVRVDMKKLDKFMNLIGELLISNIRLNTITKKYDMTDIKPVLAGLDHLVSELRDEVMEIRMVPIGNIFNRFPRMVRDIAAKEKKKVNLVIEGQEIEFDRTILDEMGDPLVHLLRNSVDHGIELPDERVNAGKEETGTIKLIARREKNNAIIEIQDDGAGIDGNLVKQSCIKKGIVTESQTANMSEKDLQMLIFKAGASTNEVVTEVSGRGVGMDVVMSKIKQLGGMIDLQSEQGKGTVVTMKLPLTIAIINSLIIRVADETCAIPLTNISETLDIKLSDVKKINNESVFVLRGKSIPLFWMSELMEIEKTTDSKLLRTVVVNSNNELMGVVVDSIESQQQILIKNLPDTVKRTRGFSGATILGDGNVALIVDVNSLFFGNGG